MIAVITTIQAPTCSVETLCGVLSRHDGGLIVIGDKKGPHHYEQPQTQLLSLAEQLHSGYRLARGLPTGHYSRKNLGYLVAMRQGYGRIYETDDDNAPNAYWVPREELIDAVSAEASGWYNVYKYFAKGPTLIWPRGLPLAKVQGKSLDAKGDGVVKTCKSPIQQGLADLDPDVDAVWRCLNPGPYTFERKMSLVLPRGTWCPFNSQSTWWWKSAFPLMYLPSHCSFRMTDIWRSLVAQRCVWEFSDGVSFHSSEVEQVRNSHNLTQDFAEEVSGHLNNDRIVELLEQLSLAPGADQVTANLYKCYETLVRHGLMPAAELDLLNDWIADLQTLPTDRSQKTRGLVP